MILETYARDDGWRRQIAYHDDGTFTFPMGIPLANPPGENESDVDYVKRVLRAHGYTLVETVS